MNITNKFLEIAREIGDRRGEGRRWAIWATPTTAWASTAAPLNTTSRHFKSTREIGDRRGEGNALGNLGIAYDSLGEYRRAIEYHEQRLANRARDRRPPG